jgi:hypothetical protein
MFTFTVCAQGRNTQTIPQDGKSLIVFYSWSGNSRTIADELKLQTSGDIAEVIPSTP